jgi:hypothetical protein
MSLAIEVDDVTAVLLADGWHTVANRSFAFDSYEHVWGADDQVMHRGGTSGICATGFAFTTRERINHGGGAVDRRTRGPDRGHAVTDTATEPTW